MGELRIRRLVREALAELRSGDRIMRKLRKAIKESGERWEQVEDIVWSEYQQYEAAMKAVWGRIHKEVGQIEHEAMEWMIKRMEQRQQRRRERFILEVLRLAKKREVDRGQWRAVLREHKRQEHWLNTEIHTVASALGRAGVIERALQIGVGIFRYAGPPPQANSHPLCKEYYNQKLHIAEIDRLRNGQIEPVRYYMGGYNCRHWWVPVMNEEKAVFGQAGGGRVFVPQWQLQYVSGEEIRAMQQIAAITYRDYELRHFPSAGRKQADGFVLDSKGNPVELYELKRITIFAQKLHLDKLLQKAFQQPARYIILYVEPEATRRYGYTFSLMRQKLVAVLQQFTGKDMYEVELVCDGKSERKSVREWQEAYC